MLRINFVYSVAKPLIWSEAEGDLVVIETSNQLAWSQSNLHLKTRSTLASFLFKGLATKHTTLKWGSYYITGDERG